jgi:iron complex outermembrane recepter protein
VKAEPIYHRLRFGVVVGTLPLLLLLAHPAHAQDATGQPPPAPAPDATGQPPPESTPAPAPDATFPLRGVVTSATDRSPQVGATVTIKTTGTTVFTDAKGEYTVSLPAGTHVVRVEIPGHLALEKTIVIADATATLDFPLSEDRLGEVITIVGSRTPRSRLETPVPVDVITSDTLIESSHTETNQILNTIAPSFNATHLSIVDGTDHIDPATLRGLGPEHVLVLVNGRRLHQSTLVNIYNGGTVGVDLNAIPTSAIARIEVLRDGAASQYGSDAIAGVINIVLKDNVDLVDAYTMTGITASGDGAQFKLGGNTGFRLGKRGFVNITGEFFSRGRTNRAGPWPSDIFPGIEGQADTDAELQRRGLTRDDFSMHVGQAGALVGTGVLNASYPLDETFELHAHAGYTLRKGYASGFYRFPTEEDRVDLRVYPNGFLPQINPRLNAYFATAGLRAHTGPWTGDLSLTYGGDSFHFFIENSINASLGQASPTSFDAGRLAFNQAVVNFDGVRKIDQPVFKSLSAVAGAELRRENYSITAGQPESYILGPEMTSGDMPQPKAPGSQVFPGFRPDDESDENRVSEAVYAGIESQPTDGTNLDIGGRFEHYSDFGNTLIGKIAARTRVFKQDDNELAVRASASTGFRAPGLQQIWYSTIATQFINDPVTNVPTPTEILVSPNRSSVAESFGVPRLKEETSINVSGGFTARLLGNLSLSADFYRVQIKDRVVLSGLFATNDAVIGDAVAAIVDEFPGVASAQFFVNAVDSTTNGVDVVIDYTHRLSRGSLKATAAANYTKSTVDDVRVPDSMAAKFSSVPGGSARVGEIFLGRYGKNRIEDLLPSAKGTLGLRYDYAGWSAGARANYFGPTEYHSDSDTDGDGVFLDESFGAKVTLDVDIGYRFGSLWLSVGANNVLNTFPDEVQRPGNRLDDSFLYTPAAFTAGAPYGIEGGFYYIRAQYRR